MEIQDTLSDAFHPSSVMVGDVKKKKKGMWRSMVVVVVVVVCHTTVLLQVPTGLATTATDIRAR